MPSEHVLACKPGYIAGRMASMRYQTTSGFSTPPVTPVVGRLLFLFTAAFILENIALFLSDVSISSLALHIGPGFHLTQILTHPFVSGNLSLASILHLLFELLILWSFGSELERLWGAYNFTRYILTGMLGGVLLSALVGLTLLPGFAVFGAGSLLASILVAYAIVWPDRQVLFFMVIPMKIKWLMLLIFLMLAIGPLNLLIFQSGGALAGALFLFYFARKGRLQSGYILSGSEGSKVLFSSIKDTLEEKKRKKRLEKKKREIQERIDMKSEVDRLLEKISQEGMDSLSRKEKSFLDKASKEL